jgi:hypothetical protein
MKFSIGDKVSFLNEKLNGKINSIVNSNMVKVEIDDGFIIDALVNELVLLEKFAVKENETDAKPQVAVAKKKVEVVFKYNEYILQFISCPAEENKLMTGNINFFIYNCTSYQLMFALYAQVQKEKRFVASGNLLKDAFLEVYNSSREELMEISNFTIQLLLIKNNMQVYQHPMVKDLPVIIPSLSNTKPNAGGISSFATYFEIANFNLPKEEELVVMKDKLQNVFQSPLQKTKAEQHTKLTEKQLREQGILLNSKEVDLHIEELIDDFSHLSNSEIMEVQLKRATQEMDVAIKNHFKRIVFIHGVGNGKLKQALRQELKNYNEVHYHDADFARYGYGATEVIF